jgi:hypothetical protein
LNIKSIKVMLLGILIMLFGGALLIDPNTNMGGVEIGIMALGLLFGLVGFFMPNSS